MAEPRPDAVERDRPYDPASTRLHVVTGKGGTGKTTVAAALALALAAGGRRVLLCEVEGRQGIAQLFDVPPLPYEERKIAVAAGGGDVYALAVEPKAALMEYLELFYRMGRAGKVLERLGAVDFATTIAPGLRDVLLTGKVYEAARRRGADRGPSTTRSCSTHRPPGASTRFLNVNEEVAGLAKVGPDPQPGRLDHVAAAQPADGGAPGDRARGDAGPGDARTPSASCGPSVCRWAASSSTWCASRCSRRRPRARRRGPARPGLVLAGLERPGSAGSRAAARARRSTASSTACSTEGAEHALRVAAGAGAARRPRGLGRPIVRAARARRAASTSARCTTSPTCSSSREWHDAATAAGTAAGRAVAPGPLLDVDALIDDPAHPDRRLLRLGRRRQDHDRRRARPARGRAGPAGRRPHHRPGPPAGPVDGAGGAGQHPAAGGRASTAPPAAGSTR